MEQTKVTPETIDAYIAMFPEAIQERLQAVRVKIKECAPEATEAISYQMPTFRLNGNLVHFAAFKNHIGFYPTPTGTEAFKEELSVYKNGKGSVQLPLDQPLPLELIGRIVAFRVEENKQKAKKQK
jgi:uncharacterized protein YdhG (YjbR/CyaY superfamily)